MFNLHTYNKLQQNGDPVSIAVSIILLSNKPKQNKNIYNCSMMSRNDI